MLLIEADGKALLTEAGIRVPDSTLADHAAAVPPDGGPWVVKAQVPVGGRGKAGGIVPCATPAEVAVALRRLLGSRLKGHLVETCLIEARAAGREAYLSVMIDPAGYGLRVMFSARGGVDIEQTGATGRLCPPHPGAAREALVELLAAESFGLRTQIAELGRKLASMALKHELALAEINPLFIDGDNYTAGDAKIVTDLAAIERQPIVSRLITARPGVYTDANRKITEGFDYVELDPDGEIGLVTTGAGLSMMLIDELTARGAKPLNFCDIRTGQMRGSPVRLMRVLEWITARGSLKAVLVNIFAGITDLAEFARLLAEAIDGTPALRVPVITRLVGRNADQARAILAERQPAMLVTEDLEEALARIGALTRGAA